MPEYIERKALVEQSFVMEGHRVVSYLDVIGVPAAEVAPVVHGRWIEGASWFTKAYYHCSVCGRSIQIDDIEDLADYPYCNCGAKMDKEE